ncbi:MAG: YitT family protein [Tissierellia bacterium]|nr:YitT family protein [Tissierellia bacterium]
MDSIKDILGDKNEIIRKLSYIFIGNIFCSIAINLFFVPNGLISGGVGGMGIIVQYLTGIPTGITVFFLNLPIFLLGYKILNKKFLVYAFISMFVFSSILTGTREIGNLIAIDDILLASIFGGIFNGIGMGLMFRNGVCQGGFDVVAAVLKRKQNINVGTGLMIVNTVIISSSSLLFGYKPAMYTLMAMYVAYQVLDKVQIGFNLQKNVIIVSNESEELSKAIMERLNRGVTLLKGEGGYTSQEKDIIYCTLTSREIARLKELVNEVDPMAFLTIYDVVEVKGKGFKTSEI